jgi:hypothetical protein
LSFSSIISASVKVSRVVPDHWFPRDELDRESYAFETLYGSKVEQTHPRKIDADAWFDRRGAERYQMLEHTFPLPNDEILMGLCGADIHLGARCGRCGQ